MTIEDARHKLYDTTFLLGRSRRRSAIRALAESPDPADTMLLAEALGKNHPNSDEVLLVYSSGYHRSGMPTRWRPSGKPGDRRHNQSSPRY